MKTKAKEIVHASNEIMYTTKSISGIRDKFNREVNVNVYFKQPSSNTFEIFIGFAPFFVRQSAICSDELTWNNFCSSLLLIISFTIAMSIFNLCSFGIVVEYALSTSDLLSVNAYIGTLRDDDFSWKSISLKADDKGCI